MATDGRELETQPPSPPQAELRHAEDWRESRRRLHLVAQATRDLIWDWDLLDGALTWAGATTTYFGDSAEVVNQASGDGHHAWAERVHPEDLPQAEAAARAALTSGADAWEHEYRFRRVDGTWVPVLERAFIIREAGGRPTRVLGAIQDLTARKTTEDATTRLAAIVSSSSDAIIGKTTTGIITSWNAAAERIFGYAAGEVLGHSVFAMIPPELHAAERALLHRIRQGERVEFSETARIRKDGSRILVALTVSPIWDASGRVIGASSIARDITERKRAEAELARREERYRALVTATSSIVWTMEPDGRFSEPQSSWEEYTGQPWDEHRGLGWAAAVHPDDRQALLEAWQCARETGQVFEARGRVWSAAHQTYRHFVARGAPVLAPDGAVREWIAMVTDVEETWITEERLRQAERMESVGRLAGGIAHEANNQMTVILGAAGFLRRELHSAEGIDDLEQIRRAAERTAGITRQLLAYSRRQVLQPQLVDLNSAIVSLEPIIQRALGEISVLVLRLAPDLDRVMADPGQLDQVLLNLTLNGRDAMPDGGMLSIETANVALSRQHVAGRGVDTIAPGPYALLAVSDTGRGMDQATLAHIFEPFFTTKEVGQGTGLGLATVYGIVKQSGGHVWVYSEPGLGTTFKVYLPRAAAPSETLPASAPEVASRGHEVILLAEDQASVRAILARSLRDYGYTVLEARDGTEALALATRQAEPPDLVIADVVMPGLGGPELVTALRRRWPDLAVLFTSGYTGLDVGDHDLLEEGQDFMQKPLDPDALARRVRQSIDAARARRGVPG
jgi:two-component system cell cycle sensor histidine kinase/response regulator CckA